MILYRLLLRAYRIPHFLLGAHLEEDIQEHGTTSVRVHLHPAAHDLMLRSHMMGGC